MEAHVPGIFGYGAGTAYATFLFRGLPGLSWGTI
jgi:hypothetical protein